MIESLRKASASLAILAALCSAAAGQETPAPAANAAPGNISWEYRGALPLGDTLLDVTVAMDRDSLIDVSAAKAAPAGWRYIGHVDAPNDIWLDLLGTARVGANGVAVLTATSRPDSIAGYLEARFDGAKEITATWHPSANASAAYVCTLRLIEEGTARYDGVFETDFIPFWNRFRDAARRHDRRAVASMTRFPIGWAGCLTDEWNGGPDVISRRNFIRKYRVILRDWIDYNLSDVEALTVRTFRSTAEDGVEIPNVDDGTMIYVVDFYSGEYYEAYYFARVNGAFKLIHCTCAG